MSYAQNFEDVMLRRALAGVRHGFYIDIGAGEPEADSVTKAFYDLGWQGINVEPLTGPFQRIASARPRDLNLNVAIGAQQGEAMLFVVGDESGLSTLDRSCAVQHREGGWAIEERRVEVQTLADVCAAHVEGDIHFLKIDAEGAELSILKSGDFSRWRPWIILLEAVDAVHHEPYAFGDWEQQVLTPNGYTFAYDDGLNRFYVAAEHAATLRPAFHKPPNVFDNFIRAAEAERENERQLDRNRYESLLQAAQERADLAQGRVHAAQDAVREEQGRVAAAEARADHAQGVANALLQEIESARRAADAASQALETAREAAGQAAERARQTAEAAQAEAVWQAVAAQQGERDRIAAERDAWAQEVFETNRYVGTLVAARQVLTDEVARLHGVIAAGQAERDRMVDEFRRVGDERSLAELNLHIVRKSTSWRVTRPIRFALRALGRRRGAGA